MLLGRWSLQTGFTVLPTMLQMPTFTLKHLHTAVSRIEIRNLEKAPTVGDAERSVHLVIYMSNLCRVLKLDYSYNGTASMSYHLTVSKARELYQNFAIALKFGKHLSSTAAPDS